MKQGIHPDYRAVVFRDASTGDTFLTRSTIETTETTETIAWSDGHEYPLVTVEVTNKSHPFWTGGDRRIDTAGRVERFHRRYPRGR